MSEGRRILWNLYNTTTIQNGSTAVCGTLLAINADFDSPYSQLNGGIILHTLKGHVEAHNFPFTGILPDPSEPIIDPTLVKALLSKGCNQSVAMPGDILKYTIYFNNLSATNMFNVTISDILPSNVTLVEGSIYPKPKASESLKTGINIGTVPAGKSRTLEYSVKVNEIGRASGRERV